MSSAEETERALRLAVTGGLTKAEANRAHAKRRALQRFGLDLKRRDLDTIGNFILAGQAVEVLRESEHLAHWHMNVGGHDLVVVFDGETKTPVTFLTPEMAARRVAKRTSTHGQHDREDDDE